MKTKTHATKKKEVSASWFLVDAEDQVLGRLASKIATVLMGKHKSNYVSYLDMGDHVVVINAAKIAVTGGKEDKKLYRWHTGYPGGLRELNLKKMREKKPNEILRKAVWGMMPKTRMGKAMIKKLHIYADEKHQYRRKELQNLI